MGFINALASGGLSTGFQIFHSLPRREVAVAPPASLENDLPEAEAPGEKKVRAKNSSPSVEPQSAEEQQAGRVEAQMGLSAAGCLGRIAAGRRPAEEEKAAASGEEPAEDRAAGLSKAKAEEEAVAASGKEPAEDRAAGDDQSGASPGPKQLTPEEEKAVAELKARDREVRSHEQAHVAAGAGMTGSPSYEYQTGPDGRRYAVGGHVSISSGGSSDPEQAVEDAQKVQQAATAPAQPSSQDMSVAAQAKQQEAQARTEVAAQKRQEAGEGGGAAEEAAGSTVNGQADDGGETQPNGRSAETGPSPEQRAAAAYRGQQNPSAGMRISRHM